MCFIFALYSLAFLLTFGGNLDKISQLSLRKKRGNIRKTKHAKTGKSQGAMFKIRRRGAREFPRFKDASSKAVPTAP